jgi:exopolyphosphatase/guanosine-5'-triphosphate,3'-diphosphate pyrophosphatase
MRAVVIGVVDIGTNTTRLLVAEIESDELRPLLQRRHFIAPGRAAIEEVARIVEREAEAARAAGAEELIVIGTAAIRRLPDAAFATTSSSY